jgi:L-glyceraldehyde 3-phosphate reductase
MSHQAATERYDNAQGWFRRCGRSGLMLPAISIGCWHNFGRVGSDSTRSSDESAFHENCREMLFRAFDLGITHFDLANNYGPPPGAAEERVGRILNKDLRSYRDELILSTKAGWDMWPGPYGNWGSRKYLLASLDASLRRLQVDYVDIFYSHRPDPSTPLEETLGALDSAVRSGKALYSGISSYPGVTTTEVIAVCERNGFIKPIIHQPSYSLLNRGIEKDLLPVTSQHGMGVIAFCPLQQGLLTRKYLKGVPKDSRAAVPSSALSPESLNRATLGTVRDLNEIAASRGQSLAQMALAWVLRSESVTSALIGASRPEQISENVVAILSKTFSEEELARIDEVLRVGNNA